MMKVDHTGKLSGELDVYMVQQSTTRTTGWNELAPKALCEAGDTIISGGCSYDDQDCEGPRQCPRG